MIGTDPLTLLPGVGDVMPDDVWPRATGAEGASNPRNSPRSTIPARMSFEIGCSTRFSLIIVNTMIYHHLQ
jgi:hypothetical protein